MNNQPNWVHYLVALVACWGGFYIAVMAMLEQYRNILGAFR